MSFDIKKVTKFRHLKEDRSHWNLVIFVIVLNIGLAFGPGLFISREFNLTYLLGLMVGVGYMIVIRSAWFDYYIERKLLHPNDRKTIEDIATEKESEDSQ